MFYRVKLDNKLRKEKVKKVVILILNLLPNNKLTTKVVELEVIIINNNKWEFDERYTGANRKTYCPELQSTFPQNVRKWSNSNMHDWQNGSIEIQEVTE